MGFQNYVKSLITEQNDVSQPKKITKKDFNTLHKAGDLGLVIGGVKGNIQKIHSLLKSAILDKLRWTKTNRMDVGSFDQGGLTVTAYKIMVDEKDFYVIEEVHDASKDKSVSWDTVSEYCTVYILKDQWPDKEVPKS